MTVELNGLTTLADGLAFTECPRWHGEWLYFSDMYGRTVYRLSEAGTLEEVVRVEQRPGGLGFAPDGDLIVAEMDAGRILRLRDGKLETHADLSAMTKYGVNDMVVSAAGRCYVGKFNHTSPIVPEPLLFVDEEGAGREVTEPLKVANGMVLSADGRTLIVAESAGGRLSAFDLDDRGLPGPRRTFAELPAGHYPDGICGDEAGGIWVTCVRGPGVIRVEEGGRVTHSLPIGDDRFSYACALGGADGRTLFVCTAGPYVPDAMTTRRDARIETIRSPYGRAGIP